MTTEYLLEREVDQVLGCLMPVNRLVCEVMLHTGLRVGDVLALRRDQLSRHMAVREAKTGKVRRVGLTADLLERLQNQAGVVYVFPSRTRPNSHRTRQAVWQDLKRAAAAYRLPQNVGTHSLRKVYAVEQLKRYGDIAKVQRALNHDNEATTLIYCMADLRLRAKQERAEKRRRQRKKGSKGQ